MCRMYTHAVNRDRRGHTFRLELDILIRDQLNCRVQSHQHQCSKPAMQQGISWHACTALTGTREACSFSQAFYLALRGSYDA